MVNTQKIIWKGRDVNTCIKLAELSRAGGKRAKQSFSENGIITFIWFIGTQRSSEIITEIYFCARPKNRQKHNQHFELLFCKLNLHIYGSSN